MSSEAKNVDWVIEKAAGNITLSKTSATVNVGANTSFTVTRNGNGVISVRSSDTSIATVAGTTTVVINGVKEGSTTIIVSCAEGDNFTAAQDKTFTVNVQKQSIAIPTVTGTSKTYSGSAQSVGIENEPAETYATLTGDKSATNAGSYSFTYTLTDTNKYKWSDNSLTPKTFNWNIEKQAVSIPTVSNTSKTYNGSSQSPTISSYDNGVVSVSGDSATNSGEYTVIMSLRDTNNYCWNDAQRSITNKTSSWSIAKANRSSISATLSGTVTYNTTGTITISGNSENGTVTAVSANTNYVTVQSTTTSSVVVKCVNYTSATTKVTITVAETSNYNQSTLTYNVSTAKANGSITLSASSGTVTYGTPATFTITSNTGGGTLHVNSADTTYATASLSNTTVTVNCVKYRSSTTVITVTSDATANYNSASATYTMTAKKAEGSLTLDKNTVSIGKESTTVQVSRAGNGVISVSGYDNSVATVSVNNTTGVITITGVLNGTTTITVSVADGTNHTKPSNKTISVTVELIMNEMTWAQIKQIAQSGKAAQIFDAGDYKDITFPTEISLDNSKKIEANSTWRVYILGIDHNSDLEGTNRIHFCIGKTTNGKEICLEEKQMNSSSTNSGGWNSCALKTWLNGTFYNALPSDLKAVITECTKYTDNTGNSSNVSENVTSTSQKIWLLAEYEVFGARSYANQYEQNSQAQYDYYKNGNSKIRYGHSGGSRWSWWLRSPYYSTSGRFHFCLVYADGVDTAYPANNTYGVVPGFTIS